MTYITEKLQDYDAVCHHIPGIREKSSICLLGLLKNVWIKKRMRDIAHPFDILLT